MLTWKQSVGVTKSKQKSVLTHNHSCSNVAILDQKLRSQISKTFATWYNNNESDFENYKAYRSMNQDYYGENKK